MRKKSSEIADWAPKIPLPRRANGAHAPMEAIEENPTLQVQKQLPDDPRRIPRKTWLSKVLKLAITRPPPNKTLPRTGS